jgi:ribosomal protein S18 acetylase RimI-like enzyme
MRKTVRTHYLEMTSPAELRPARKEVASDLIARRVEVVCPELNRFLYTSVGGAWYWTDRLGWKYADWEAYLDRSELETWVGYVGGNPVGYFELERQEGGDVEIVYFGLIPAFIGRGHGGRLLTRAVERAWEMNARRVWVHTCTLDGPAALANYQARGFRVYREAEAEQELSSRPPGPWPNAFAG